MLLNYPLTQFIKLFFYNYICIHLLLFFTVKLSIFSSLCLKHKRVMSMSTHTKIKKFYTDLKKLCCIGSISVSVDTQNIWYRIVSVLKKRYRASPSIVVHPKRVTIMWGGLSSTTTSVQHPPDDATDATGRWHQCAHHTPATGGEERESLSQSSLHLWCLIMLPT